jgi:AraC family transcriptional regulator
MIDGTSSFGSPLARRRIGRFGISLTRYDGRTVLPWHEHDAPYLTFVLTGAYRESLRGGMRECTRRSAVYHPAGERHRDEFGRRATACLDLSFDSAWLLSVQSRGCATDRASLVDSPAVARIGAGIVREFRGADGVSPMIVEGLLLELFAENERRRNAPTAPPWLRLVREMAESRCTTGVSLSEMAAEAGVHPTHLARTFRAQYGSTIGEFVRARRVELAKDRIRAGAAFADIALDLGFADQSHFARTFRTFTGQTPTEFRRSLR